MNTYTKMSINIVTIFFLVAATLVSVSSDRILFLVPMATKSETHLLNPLAKGMIERGHHVTYVTPASANIKHSNFTEIIPLKPLDGTDFYGSADLLDMRRARDDLANIVYVDISFMFDGCHTTYKHKDFQQVLQAESYDLVVTNAFFSECFFGLIYKLKAPYILLSSMPLPKHTMEMTGLRAPLSFVPCPYMPFTDNMSLSQRLFNTLSSWSYSLLNEQHYFKIHEKIYKQYLGDDMPSIESLAKNVSLIFSNTHFSLNFPRPLMPDIIEIGGVHCRPSEPLPKDIKEFVSGAKHGVIFFSMGTVIQENNMSEDLRNIFINVFSRLEHRVLWKWNGNPIENLPSNVKISKWLPQQDVLGHPNVKLFISHGGLLGTTESTYHATPILGIPMFVDQDVNMKLAEAHGYAVKLEVLELTEDIFEKSIHKMLNDPSYAENAKLASQLLRDQPQTPIDRALWYMEYIIRQKGVPTLRSYARNLTYFQYHLYDVQLILLGVTTIIVLIVWKIISCILRLSHKFDRYDKVGRSKKNR